MASDPKRAFARFAKQFITAFLKSARSSQRSRSEREPRSKQQPQRTLPGKPQSPRTSFEVDGSPGQFGASATHDLPSQDIAMIRPLYDPEPDGSPDPGEIVWTWVPYVENDGRGKDRPVLIVARLDKTWTVGCYLSSKEHRGFISIGAGPWDSQGRESFVSPERLLKVSNDGMRREATVLPQGQYDKVVRVLTERYGFTRR